IASLKAQQYYAHPQNLFWKIMGEALSFEAACPYAERIDRLLAANVAVWDVLKACVREGSLDANIDKTSVVPNDFTSFFANHALIERVCFNGRAAASLFMRYVQPHLPCHANLRYIALPSTSPANASIPLAHKLRDWNAAIRLERELKP
ncbi:MAG: hypothetical protein JWM03_1591, partial [Rhodocyclales bacterium]|nr:hypothetical protein [Rhodocyclales bacterium]